MGFIYDSFIECQNNFEFSDNFKKVMNKDDNIINEKNISEKQLEEELNYSKNCSLKNEDNEINLNNDDDLGYEEIYSKSNYNDEYIFEENGNIKDIEIYITRDNNCDILLDWVNENMCIYGEIIQNYYVINTFWIEDQLMLNLIQGNNIIEDNSFKFKLTFINDKNIFVRNDIENYFLKISIVNDNKLEWYIKYKIKKHDDIYDCNGKKHYNYGVSTNEYNSFTISCRYNYITNSCNLNLHKYTSFIILLTNLDTLINSFELFINSTKVYEQTEFKTIEYYTMKLYLISFDPNIENFDDIKDFIENKKKKTNGIRIKKNNVTAIINKDTSMSEYFSDQKFYATILSFSPSKIIELLGTFDTFRVK